MLEIYVLLICVLLVHADKTACKVRLSKETKSASLVFYFSEDIRRSQKDFAIYHLNAKGRTETVVDCLWESEGLKCITRKNYYKIDTTVSDRFTVHIHNVTEDASGLYSCQTSGMKREDAGFCKLSTGETACEIRAGNITPESTLTCHFPEDIGISKKDFSVYHFHLKGRPDAVVDCRWMSDKLSCSAMPGYDYDNVVTSSATVIMPKKTHDPGGQYACHITGTQLEEVRLCRHASAATTTCQIIPNDAAAENQLTCFFNEDISHSKKHFFVSYFHNGGSSVDVVDCSWHMDRLNCSTFPGYHAATTASHQFSVVIPQLSESQTGSYQCHVSGAPPSHASRCGLPLNACKTEDSSPCLRVTVPIISILGVTVLFLSILVLRQGLRSKYHNRQNRNNNEDTENNDSEANTSGENSSRSNETSEFDINSEVSQLSENHSVPRQRNRIDHI